MDTSHTTIGNDFAEYFKRHPQAEGYSVDTHLANLQPALPYFGKELDCNMRSGPAFSMSLVDARLINHEKIPSYRGLFVQARKVERTLEHRAENDARTREADRHTLTHCTSYIRTSDGRSPRRARAGPYSTSRHRFLLRGGSRTSSSHHHRRGPPTSRRVAQRTKWDSMLRIICPFSSLARDCQSSPRLKSSQSRTLVQQYYAESS